MYYKAYCQWLEVESFIAIYLFIMENSRSILGCLAIWKMAFLHILFTSLHSSNFWYSDLKLTSLVGYLARISLSSQRVQASSLSWMTFWQMKISGLLSRMVGVLKNLWLFYTLKIYLLAGLNFLMNGASAFLTFSLTKSIFLLGELSLSEEGLSLLGVTSSLWRPPFLTNCFLSVCKWSLTST